MRLVPTLLSGSLIFFGVSGDIINSIECLAVNVEVQALEALINPTPFCSSFLGIQTSTVTTTTTTTLSTVFTTTTRTIGTSTITPPPVTTTVTSTSTSSYCRPAAASANRKRQAGLPSQIAAFPSPLISTACSCLNIPTPTSTVTATATNRPTSTVTKSVIATVTAPASTVTSTVSTTTTVTACPTPPQCGNGGLQYGAFKNPEGMNDVPSGYASYDPTYVKASNNGAQYLLYSSTVNPPGNFRAQCASDTSTTNVYGSSNTIPCTYYSLDHRGYFFAPTSGNYTFSATNIDDIVLFWGGDIARVGWARPNANFVGAVGVSQNAGAYTVALVQGQYFPIRIMFGQAQRNFYSFNFSIKDPFGDVIVSTTSSPYLVQYSCDGRAPAFPGAFGQEP